MDKPSEGAGGGPQCRKGAKYTKNRRPVVLKYYETFSTKQEAMRREWAVKQLSRKEKLALIGQFEEQKMSEQQ